MASQACATNLEEPWEAVAVLRCLRQNRPAAKNELTPESMKDTTKRELFYNSSLPLAPISYVISYSLYGV